MKYKIIDNFLPIDVFENIKQKMLGANFPWFYNSFIVTSTEERTIKKQFDYQFTHNFYRDYQTTSDWFQLLEPLILKINPAAIIRIKANLNPSTEERVIHQYHLDHEQFDGKVAVFYINTNNGVTMFKDGTVIESVENRLAVFDPDILHTGTSCTDQQVRCLINIMFYQWTDSSW
jgi:hypothetical protein